MEFQINMLAYSLFFIGFCLFYLTENEIIKNPFFVKSYYFVLFLFSLLYIYGTKKQTFLIDNVFVPLGKIIFAFLIIELLLYILEFIKSKKTTEKETIESE